MIHLPFRKSTGLRYKIDWYQSTVWRFSFYHSWYESKKFPPAPRSISCPDRNRRKSAFTWNRKEVKNGKIKVHIHFRKFSTERKIFRGPHAQYDFFLQKIRTAHAVRGKFSEVYMHL